MVIPHTRKNGLFPLIFLVGLTVMAVGYKPIGNGVVESVLASDVDLLMPKLEGETTNVLRINDSVNESPSDKNFKIPIEDEEVLKSLYGGAFDEIHHNWNWYPSENEKTEMIKKLHSKGLATKWGPKEFSWLVLQVTADIPIKTNNRNERFLITEMTACGGGRCDREDKDILGELYPYTRHTIKGAAIFAYSPKDKKWMLKKANKYMEIWRASGIGLTYSSEKRHPPLHVVGPDRFGLVVTTTYTGSNLSGSLIHVIGENKLSIQYLGYFDKGYDQGPLVDDDGKTYDRGFSKFLESIKFIPSPAKEYYDLHLTTDTYTYTEYPTEYEYCHCPKTKSYVWSESESKYKLVNASESGEALQSRLDAMETLKRGLDQKDIREIPTSSGGIVPPIYPRIAREAGWEGTVLVRVSVQPDGSPESVKIQKSSGHSILDTAAIEAVNKWKFSPAKDGNIPIRSVVEIPINFDLRNQQE